jgi:hypothetical protein
LKVRIHNLALCTLARSLKEQLGSRGHEGYLGLPEKGCVLLNFPKCRTEAIITMKEGSIKSGLLALIYTISTKTLGPLRILLFIKD